MIFKILHITLDNRYGGIYRYIEYWATADYTNKINTKHYTFKYARVNKNIDLINTEVSNLRKKSGYLFILDTFLNIYNFIFYSKNKDLIILHSTYLLPIGLILIFLRKKVFFLIHDFNNLNLFKFILLTFLRKKLLFVAPWLKESFVGNKNSTNSNTRENIYLPLIKKSIKKNINFLKNEKKLKLIYIGSLSPVKGISDFINLLNIGSFNIEVDVIGENNPRYVSKLPLLNKPSVIKYHGSIYSEIEKIKFINNSNFAIIPSRSEAFPFVYQEYLNAGKIPLCSDIEVFNELSRRKDHIFSSKNFESFYKCINWASNISEKEYLSYLNDLTEHFNLFSKKYRNFSHLSIDFK